MKRKKRIGIFGGTFDPIHVGHLIIAEIALSELSLDTILFIPAAIPPHKQHRNRSPAKIRARLVAAAIADRAEFELSEIELNRPDVSYMIDTLDELQASTDGQAAEFFLIIGADNYLTFPNWREHKRLLTMATLAVYPRYDADVSQSSADLQRHAIFFDAPRMEISSSFVRTLVHDGRAITYLVPEKVERLISALGLYRQPEKRTEKTSLPRR